MEKTPAPYVKARQAHVEAVREQRSVGEVLREAPVDGVIVTACNLPPVLQHLLDVGMQHETRWRRCKAFYDGPQPIERKRCADRPVVLRSRRAAGGLRGRRDALLRLCDGQDCEGFGLQPIELVSSRNPPADELFAVKLDDASVTLDSTLHRGPRDRRIVARKVAMTAVAYMVDGDVRAKFHSILGCELRHKHDRIGIIRIDMNDWRIDCPCGIRA